MKVATITCVGHHPKGLALHLNNLHWAVDRPHECHVVTKRGWNLEGDCRFTLVESALGEHYDFWGRTLPNLIRSIDADVLVITQCDMFYNQHLGDIIDTVHKENCVVMNSDPYGWAIYKDEQFVFHRIWEGGLIVRKERLVEHLDRGCGMGYTILGEATIQLIRDRFDGEYINEPRGQKRLTTEIPLGEPIDLLFEFQLWCYYEKVDVRRIKILSHMLRPECFHRRNPWIYDEITPFHINMFKNENTDVVGSTLFMYVMSGVTSFNEHIQPILNENPFVHSCINYLSPHVHEWMPPRELATFEEIKTYVRRQVPFF